MPQTIITIVIVLALVILFFWMVPLRLWFNALLNGYPDALASRSAGYDCQFHDYRFEGGHRHQP